jgi:hypothetical protein
MSFWDPQYMEEQRRRRMEEDRKRLEQQRIRKMRDNEAAAKVKKQKALKKKRRQEEIEEEEKKRQTEQESGQEEKKEEKWVPPVLNRGFGPGFGVGRAAIGKDAQEQLKRNEAEMQRRAMEEKAQSGSSETDMLPKLSRPF